MIYSKSWHLLYFKVIHSFPSNGIAQVHNVNVSETMYISFSLSYVYITRINMKHSPVQLVNLTFYQEGTFSYSHVNQQIHKQIVINLDFIFTRYFLVPLPSQLGENSIKMMYLMASALRHTRCGFATRSNHDEKWISNRITDSQPSNQCDRQLNHSKNG